MTQQRKTTAHRRKRRALRELITAWLNEGVAEAELRAAEARHQITRIEAAAFDDFQADMANVTDNAVGRQNLRDAALALGRLGISGYSDVEPMVQMHYVATSHGVTIDDVRMIGQMKMRARWSSRFSPRPVGGDR